MRNRQAPKEKENAFEASCITGKYHKGTENNLNSETFTSCGKDLITIIYNLLFIYPLSSIIFISTFYFFLVAEKEPQCLAFLLSMKMKRKKPWPYGLRTAGNKICIILSLFFLSIPSDSTSVFDSYTFQVG